MLPLYTSVPFATAVAALTVCALAAFFLFGENAPFDETRIVTVAVMTAAAVAGRAAFAFIPSFKPIAAVVVLCGAYLGCGSGFLCGALSMLLSNFLFGQGPWTTFQMLGMGLVGFVAGALRPVRNIPVLAVWGAVGSYLYGAITDIWTLFSLGGAATWPAYLAVAAAGLPSSTVLAVSTVLFVVVLGAPFARKFERLRRRYGWAPANARCRRPIRPECRAVGTPLRTDSSADDERKAALRLRAEPVCFLSPSAAGPVRLFPKVFLDFFPER